MDFESIVRSVRSNRYMVEPTQDMQSAVNDVAREFGGDARRLQPTVDGDMLEVSVAQAEPKEEVIQRLSEYDSVAVVREA